MRAVKGGVSCVQLRDYESDFATTLKTAFHLKNLLQGVPLFINTPYAIELAKAVRAEGVFLEEKVPMARKMLGEKAIIGVSVRTIEDIRAEADYLSVKVSPSKQTCSKNDLLWGMEGLRTIRALSSRRIVAVGGLNVESAESIYRELRAGDGIAMAGGLMNEIDPCATARKIVAMRGKL